jgi:hypothetical protein
MSVLSGIPYAQARIQSRYGRRADAGVWLKLQNIHDLGSYLQTAQQTPLRHWVLGLSSSHNSHEIELALRQKYRHHIDEVANWMPVDWKKTVQWIKRLVDLPVLQYLVDGGEPLPWMKSDPNINDFTVDDPALRLQAFRLGGNSIMVDSWQQSGSIVTGWLTQWERMLPKSGYSHRGLELLEKLFHDQIQLQTKQQEAAQPTDYEMLFDRLRLIFRRYAFQPSAVCAYLAIVALDVHRVRSDLIQRTYFRPSWDIERDLPQ